MLGKEHAYRFSQVSAWAEVRSYLENRKLLKVMNTISPRQAVLEALSITEYKTKKASHLKVHVCTQGSEYCRC